MCIEELNTIVNSFERDTGIKLSYIIESSSLNLNQNHEDRCVSASLIKPFIFAAVIDSVIKGKLVLSSEISVTKKDYVKGSGLIKYSDSSFKLNLENLLVLMLSYSDNIATNLIIDRMGKETINQYISQNKFASTKLICEMMKSEDYPNTTSCYDIHKLYKRIFFSEDSYSDLATSIVEKCFIGNLSSAKYKKSTLNSLLKSLISTNNAQALPFYEKNSIDRNDNSRLAENLDLEKLVFQKSGTSKTSYIDSIVMKTNKDFIFCTLFANHPKGNFTVPKEILTRKVKSFFSQFGSLTQNIILEHGSN